MTGRLPSLEEFSDFSQLSRLLQSVPPQSGKADDLPSADVDWNYTNPSSVEALKQHTIYNFLINDPLFQKAVVRFKYTAFYKDCVARGEEIHEWVLFRLMRVISLTAGAYLVEGKNDTKAVRKVYLVNRKSCISKVKRAEKVLEKICSKFPYYDTINIRKSINDLKIHIQSKTPSWYPERYSGYVAQRLAVWRLCQLFDAAFGEISTRVIRHLVYIIFINDKIEISADLFNEWASQAKDEIQFAKSLTAIKCCKS